MLTDYYFWFAQPASILNNYDWILGYIFAGLFGLGVVFWMFKWAVTHLVIKKLFGKWANALIWIGLIGLIWFGFRYQAIPIFSKRVFGGTIIFAGLVWLGFIIWYLARYYFKEKREYDFNQVKSKYIPGKR